MAAANRGKVKGAGTVVTAADKLRQARSELTKVRNDRDAYRIQAQNLREDLIECQSTIDHQDREIRELRAELDRLKG